MPLKSSFDLEALYDIPADDKYLCMPSPHFLKGKVIIKVCFIVFLFFFKMNTTPSKRNECKFIKSKW